MFIEESGAEINKICFIHTMWKVQMAQVHCTGDSWKNISLTEMCMCEREVHQNSEHIMSTKHTHIPFLHEDKNIESVMY